MYIITVNEADDVTTQESFLHDNAARNTALKVTGIGYDELLTRKYMCYKHSVESLIRYWVIAIFLTYKCVFRTNAPQRNTYTPAILRSTSRNSMPTKTDVVRQSRERLYSKSPSKITNLEDHADICLSATLVDNHYNVIR